MSMSNATENATLRMHLQGTDPSYRAGATQWLALFTADPGEAGSLAAEATYTGYARIPLTKSSAWTDGGSSFTNANLLQFGACTAGTNAITHAAVVDTASGAVNQMIRAALSATLNVSAGIQPQFAIGALTITAD
ncbi:MAG: hypothetical protein ING91_19550 [Rhodocyclaceae bacterium]|nr:hypothetical protein [Rhodocyclaceae bacterium]MCA3848763.1 hypothetical protein [Burkholderia sp.]